MNWGSFPVQRLAQQARPFLVNGGNVKVLYSPNSFFEALKEGILGARKRVVFSSLYLGTGTREKELVECFHTLLSNGSRSSSLKCTLLLDHLRGSRGQPNSKTMVQSLAPYFGDGSFTLGLFHTPNLRGAAKFLLPERFNEVMGLQHMKIYLFDDDVMISGANLSRDYFVDRQDRYVLFKDSKELADYFADVVDLTLSHSYTLNSDGSTLPPSALAIDPLSSAKGAEMFKASLGKAMKQLMGSDQPLPVDTILTSKGAEKSVGKATRGSDHQPDPILCSNGAQMSLMGSDEPLPDLTATESSSELDTVVCPLIQMGFCGIRLEEEVTLELLSSLCKDDSLYLASGYFNLPPLYSEALFNGRGTCNILAASPQANGFYGARGVAGHVPAMYMHFARKFLEGVVRTGNQERVRYWEYSRPNWTFHGKGAWFYPRGEEWPVATLVGSSNYGYRSLTCDLEVQVAVATKNVALRKALHEERISMFNYAGEMTLEQVRGDPTRKLTIPERVATAFLQPYV